MENRNGLKDIFDKTMNEVANETNDNRILMVRLESRMKNTLSERKQNIMIMAESMVDDSKILVDQWMNSWMSELIKKNDQKMNEIQNNVIKQM